MDSARCTRSVKTLDARGATPRESPLRFTHLLSIFFFWLIYDFANTDKELITFWRRTGTKIAVHAAIEDLTKCSSATKRRLTKDVIEW